MHMQVCMHSVGLFCAVHMDVCGDNHTCTRPHMYWGTWWGTCRSMGWITAVW